MSGEIDGRVIRSVDMNLESFKADWKAMPSEVKSEAKKTIQNLLFTELDKVPAKLHFHQLTEKEVKSRLDSKVKVKAWSLHLTADDRYKASFTYEGGTLYFRTCGLHDAVDKKP